MKDKKVNIKEAALELFANQGFAGTSTKEIAKRAKVSEGLIFRHFDSKQGLLDTIIKDGEKRVNEFLGPIVFETSPKEVIRKSIEMPFNVKNKEYNFWKLLFQLKWTVHYHNPEKMKPLIDKLTWAFKELLYPMPESEAILLNQLIETISVSLIRGEITDLKTYKTFLLSKYLA